MNIFEKSEKKKSRDRVDTRLSRNSVLTHVALSGKKTSVDYRQIAVAFSIP